jgi:hypothetical protein
LGYTHLSATKEVWLKEQSEEHREREAEQARKPYAAPLLRCHGSVRRLTLGGGASSVDGVNTTMMA